MKKLLTVAAFIVVGITATYAQAPSKKVSQAPATVAPAAKATEAAVMVDAVVTDDAAVATPAAAKTSGKKECSADEKKACGTKAGKKSCCSSKAEAKKEDGK